MTQFMIILFVWSFGSVSAAELFDLPPPQQTKEHFLSSLQRPHNDFSAAIDPFMMKLTNEDIFWVFQGLVEYFQKKRCNGYVLPSEINALQPWSIPAFEIWKDNLVFKKYYARFLETYHWMHNVFEKRTPQEKVIFLTSEDPPVFINHRLKGYKQQCQALIAFQEIEKGTLKDAEHILYKLFGHLAALKNTPLTFFLINVYKYNPEMVYPFFRESLFTGHTQSIFAFLEKDPSLLSMKNGETPLHPACFMGYRELTSALLKKFPELFPLKNNQGETALHLACQNGKTQMVLDLLEFAKKNGYTDFIKTVTHSGSTPLHHACMGENGEKTVTVLLGQDPSLLPLQDGNKATALHLSCQKGYMPTVRTLIAFAKKHNYADFLKIPDQKGATALHRACQQHNAQIVLALLKEEPSLILIKDHHQKTALHYASSGRIMGGEVCEFPQIITTLLEKNSSLLTLQDDNGSTALHIACSFGNDQTAWALLRFSQNYGLDVFDIKDKEEKTALHVARDHHQIRLLQSLKVNDTVWDFLDENEDFWDFFY